MIIRSKAPLRLGLAGGGTDVSPYCDYYGGTVLNVTIDMYAYCTIEPTEDGKIEFYAADRNERVQADSVSELPIEGDLLLHRGVYNRIVSDYCGGKPLSFRMTTYSDAPAGSGLGSSSTMVVAIIKAYMEWLNLPLGEYDIAALAYQIERVDLGLSGGKQDQYAATFGGFNFIEFHGRNNVVVNPLRIRRDIINELQYNLLLCYTGNIHVSANIIKDQVSNYKKPDAFQAMCEVKALSYAMKDELLKGNLHNFGRLLDYGWESKKRMSSKITNPQIDMLYDEAKKAGALGGKLLGAGGGGFLLVYCPYNVKHQVARRLESAGGQLMDWNFELRGAQSWICDEDRWDYRDIQVQMPDKEYTFHV